MSDDAVAPVVAAMIILAIGVTFFAAWNAYYVPSMKAQSEITHLKDVETGFLKFSSDIGTAASLKRNMQLSESIPLGGGDFTFDGVKSGGSLRIQNETEGYLRIIIRNGTSYGPTRYLLHYANYSYQPVNNFWQDQGYVWSYGNVNVTKGALATPLQYPGMDAVTYGMAGTLFELDAAPSPDDPSMCNLVNIYTVNITPFAGHTFASGNGNGMLELGSTISNQQFSNASGITIEINPDLPDGFRNALLNAVNRSFDGIADCKNVNQPVYLSKTEIQLSFDTIPNMTLNRKITEIALGAE